VDAARTLITAGAKVQCRTAKGATPLHYAAQAGASVSGMGALSCRLTRRRAGCVRLVEVLLRKKADPLAQNKQGKTPLDLATGDALALLQKRAAPGGDADADADAEEAEPAAGEAAAAEPEAAAEGEDAAPVAGPAPRPKRSVAEGVVAAADEDAGTAKRPKVTLSFDDGADDGEDA
jgi:ankyrin repeat protein